MEKGMELQGKYMILRLLGEGGEGKTYLAYDGQANRNVAVREWKERPSESRLAAWDKMIDLGKLPGIAQLYEVWEEDDVCYMTLEYVEGQNGVKYLESQPQGMDPAQAMQMMAPVAEGLSILHESGLLHRDISTDNLLIKGDGTALLCDPGLLCDMQGGIDPVNRVKNGFSPLEMYLEEGKQGTWSDVYEFCATLCHLMTGQILPAPALRGGEDAFAGKQMNLPAASLDLLCAGLEVEWEKRLRDLKSFCQIDMPGDPKVSQSESLQSPSEKQQSVTEPYIAQPRMRTLPVNTQDVMSLQPDNAMNAGHRKNRSDRGRIFGAVGIVALLVALVFGGFAFYQAKNDEDSEIAEDEDKKDKKSKTDKDKDDENDDDDSEDDSGDEEEQSARVEGDGVISWDELMERYAQYLRNHNTIDFDSYKLVDINDDELPECFLGFQQGGSIENIAGVLYYNQMEDEIVYADPIHTGNFAFEYGERIKYAEGENIFFVDDQTKLDSGKFFGQGTFFSFGADGRLERVGMVRAVPDSETDIMNYYIGNDRKVEEAEYEEYISDFGELNDHFDYQDMYVSLDKAYEKYLEGK